MNLKLGLKVYHWKHGEGRVSSININSEGKVEGLVNVTFRNKIVHFTTDEELSYTPYDLVYGGFCNKFIPEFKEGDKVMCMVPSSLSNPVFRLCTFFSNGINGQGFYVKETKGLIDCIYHDNEIIKL